MITTQSNKENVFAGHLKAKKKILGDHIDVLTVDSGSLSAQWQHIVGLLSVQLSLITMFSSFSNIRVITHGKRSRVCLGRYYGQGKKYIKQRVNIEKDPK